MVDQGSPSLEIPRCALPPTTMLYVGLTRAEREKAADLVQGLLDMVDDGHLLPTDRLRPRAMVISVTMTALQS